MANRRGRCRRCALDNDFTISWFILDMQTMGINYVVQKPYDMAETYEETSPATPMFFVLFPGVDPTPWVEHLARTLDISTDNGESAQRARIFFVCLQRIVYLFRKGKCGLRHAYDPIPGNTQGRSRHPQVTRHILPHHIPEIRGWPVRFYFPVIS